MERKKLGPEKYEKMELNVLLSEELPPRLSLLRQQSSNLIVEREKSLQKRNIIESRSSKLLLRKYPKKYMERYDYKVFNREQAEKYANLGKEQINTE